MDPISIISIVSLVVSGVVAIANVINRIRKSSCVYTDIDGNKYEMDMKTGKKDSKEEDKEIKDPS